MKKIKTMGKGNRMKPHDALREYINKSELRIISNSFRVRMSKTIVKNFDAGLYDSVLKEHKKCIRELKSLNIKYPANAVPVFYMYIVPDDKFVELLDYPYKNTKGGGRPVASYDMDGFNSAYGTSQNLLLDNGKINVTKHVNHIHEYAHLIHQQFRFCQQIFSEGFAELIPWYALEYERKVPEHCIAMSELDKIYTANELLESVVFSDKVSGKTCSFQASYISSYLWSRAVAEHIRVKYKLSRKQAVQKLLELYAFTKYGKQWFISELAEILGMNAEKLLDSTEYQIKMLKQIEKEIKG